MSLFNFLITDVFAGAPLQTTSAPATHTTPNAGGGFVSLLPMLIIFFLVFYFLIIRPQSKRAKEHQRLVSGLTKGDEVMTSGGIVGRVSRMNDDFVVLSVAEGVEITVQKGAIANVLPKGTLKSII